MCIRDRIYRGGSIFENSTDSGDINLFIPDRRDKDQILQTTVASPGFVEIHVNSNITSDNATLYVEDRDRRSSLVIKLPKFGDDAEGFKIIYLLVGLGVVALIIGIAVAIYKLRNNSGGRRKGEESEGEDRIAAVNVSEYRPPQVSQKVR
eukprot:TRINITY_DN13853_c0_g2_i2.p1 TRINITY_DN13853_c0_g2~~TRINITY_DN13853_c0_g2_i2.p1  ORF type:complete len:170 (-),score=30.67 TRINITY_DN13853_c0_g2_i2:88-537(-)